MRVDCPISNYQIGHVANGRLHRMRLADALGLDKASVSVKAKTNEKMGALGRGEGVGVMAVAAVGRQETS